MAQAGKVAVVSTNASTQFRATLAQNAALFLSLDVASFGLGQRVDAIIKGIQILSVENLAWELWFFRTAAQDAADPNVNRWTGLWTFAAASGLQVGAAGLYHYSVTGLEIPYQDEDGTSKVHMALINRSVGAKSAGDAGRIRVQLVLEPTAGM